MNEREQSLVDNTADEEQVKKAIELENRQQNLVDESYRKLLATDFGQVVMFDLLSFCGPFESPFREDDRLTHVTIGRQDVSRYVIKRMDKVNPSWLQAVMQRAPKPHPTSTRRRNARRNRPSDSTDSRVADARGSGARADRQPTTE